MKQKSSSNFSYSCGNNVVLRWDGCDHIPSTPVSALFCMDKNLPGRPSSWEKRALFVNE